MLASTGVPSVKAGLKSNLGRRLLGSLWNRFIMSEFLPFRVGDIYLGCLKKVIINAMELGTDETRGHI